MITVKLFGNVQKILDTKILTLDFDNKSINDLLEHLLNQTNHKFDINNILIAVNDTDSTALDGKSTKLNNGDTVSIIPIIHGGSDTFFKILNSQIQLVVISGKYKLDADFLTTLRELYPKLTLQAITIKSILNFSYIKKILTISLSHKKHNSILSKKLEIDILMRFAHSTQIAESLNNVGITKGTNFILIGIGNKSLLSKLRLELEKYTLDSPTFPTRTMIKNRYRITKKHLDSIRSDTPLEDLLVEKSNILFS